MMNRDVPKSQHRNLIYREQRDFLELAGGLISRAFARAEGVVVFCTKEHWNLLGTSLPGFASAQAQSQIFFADVHLSMLRIRDEEGVPEFSRFMDLLGEVVGRFGACRPPIQIYAELTNVLCAAGAEGQAAVLEGFWNAFLSVNCDCTLVAGYDVRNLPLRGEPIRFRRREAREPSARA